MLRKRQSGFTLLELAIVALVLILLAGILIPQFQGALADAQTSGTRQMLERVRTAVEFYSFQHDQELPGQAGGLWSSQALLDQLTMATDISGATATPGTPGFPFGPYLTESLGNNPFNDLNAVLVIGPGGSMNEPDNATGWVYFAETGAFRANAIGSCSSGSAVWDL